MCIQINLSFHYEHVTWLIGNTIYFEYSFNHPPCEWLDKDNGNEFIISCVRIKRVKLTILCERGSEPHNKNYVWIQAQTQQKEICVLRKWTLSIGLACK